MNTFTETNYDSVEELITDVKCGKQISTWQPGVLPPIQNGTDIICGPWSNPTWAVTCSIANGIITGILCRGKNA